MRALAARAVRRWAAALALAGVAVFASGCASGPAAPKPAELPPNVPLLAAPLAWKAMLPEARFPLAIHVQGSHVTVAGSDGTVLALDALDGRTLWQAALGEALSAGVGSDGVRTAVVTRANQLVVIEAGKTLWREKLPAQAYTAPLVAGERVFVLAADRSVLAFDGRTGRRLWTQQTPGEPLVLSQPGVLLAVGDTLVAGLSGRLVGMDPLSGNPRWEATVASSRGTNDVERLIDLVGRVSRQGDVVCARAFQAAVGCVDTARGQVLWSRPAQGAEGVHGDEERVYGTEFDGRLIAWRRQDGERAWETDRLKYRGLTAPLVMGRAVVVGDRTGLVHLLARADGAPLNRLSTDGSGLAAAPVAAQGTLVVVTRDGGIYGFRPE